MNKPLFKSFSWITILALMLMAVPMQSAQAASPTELLISEYIEGTSFNKAVEIYNGTGSAVNLSTYTVELYSNGAASPSQSVTLSGTLADGDVFVLAHASADPAILAVTDLQNSAVINFNGDDALVLRNSGAVVDAFGQTGVDPGSEWPGGGVDDTLRRAATVCAGDTNAADAFDASVEWVTFAVNTFGGLGAHTANCSEEDVAPSVTGTTPDNGATTVAVTSNIDVTFSEDVNVSAASFALSCTTSGAHTVAVSGGPVSFTVDPDTDFANSETCTVTVVAAQVSDVDANDPPDSMGADYVFSFDTAAAAVASDLVINEIDYDQPGADTAEFVEIRNNDSVSVDLSAYSIQMINGNAGGSAQYRLFALPALSLAAGDYFVLCANNTTVANCDLDVSPDTDLIQNGAPDAVALLFNATVIDTVSYEGDTSGSYTEGSGAGLVDSGSGTQSISRCPDGSDTDVNNMDFSEHTSTPGTANACVADDAPMVSSTTPTSGASNIAVGSNIDVTFSEDVTVSASSFGISCTTSGAHTVAVSGGPTTFTLNPDTDFVSTETCTVTVVAVQVSDVDANDPPDTMAADYVFSFSTEGPVCEQTYTPIYSIQGNGTAAAITGNVTTQGVVVGDFEGATTVGIQGFYIQDPTGDGDAATSDGIFVYTGDNNNNLSTGDLVRVTGFARERFNQTALNGSNSNSSPVTSIVNCGTGSVTPVDIVMPFSSATYLEQFEGMLVHFPQALVIAEYFNYERFGEMVLALPLDGETRPFTGTAIDEPGAPAIARAQANSLRRITLDDGLGSQNPPSLRHPNGNPVALDNLFRGGDTVQNAVGVIGFDFSLYRIHPTAPADYTSVNPRPAEPEEVGGRLKLAAMNTLNFFLTLDTTANDNGPGPCGGNANLDCRGADADQPDEFSRQRTKLIAALAGLNADVIGLNELENTPGVDPLGDPTNGVVAGLNALPGADPYARIDTGVIGSDAIRVGLIYRPSKVTPVGDFKILDSSVDPRFLDTKSRPALAQTFEEVATGERFTVVVNHLKSKGSDCNDVGDPDAGDGQGNCSGTRTLAAQALVDWLATDPTGSGDPDFIIMGDLNSYAQEDPIDAIKAGSDDTAGTGDDYTNLISQYQGTYAYSYTFDGQAGYLDHALANQTLTAQVAGAADWHINSDEPDLLDYDTTFKPPAQDAIYEPNEYRSSDHDPVIIGLNLVPQCNGQNATVYVNHLGKIVGGALNGQTYSGLLAGTNGSDVIVGTGSGDTILALNGNDVVCSLGGSDTIFAGAGDDTIHSGAGNDTVFGNANNDVIDTGAGNDVAFGESGNDVIDTGADNDAAFGGDGADQIDTGAGQDVVEGGQGADTLLGGDNNDTILGGAGNDALHGGSGNDACNGGGGTDTSTTCEIKISIP